MFIASSVFITSHRQHPSWNTSRDAGGEGGRGGETYEQGLLFGHKKIFIQMTKFQHELSLRVFDLFQWFTAQKTSIFHEKIIGLHLINI